MPRFVRFVFSHLRGLCYPGFSFVRTFSSQPAWYDLVPDGVAYCCGSWNKSSTGKTFPVFNPANGQTLRTVPCMTPAEASSAIVKAKQVQCERWSVLPTNDRAEVIRRWARAIEANQDALARLITDENGKILSDARAEVSAGVTALDWYAEEAKRTYGYFVPPLHVTNRKQIVQHHPVGVVGVITPWNFPLSMITRKVGAALAAGCAVVIKPAEDTPLSALALAYLASKADLPPGLLSVITTPRVDAEAVGDMLCQHPDVRLLGFTGSTAVGKMLYHKAAAHGKRVLMELGGNAPFIIFKSANLDKAVAGTVACKFRCSGQTCVSANRILVQADIYDQFVEKLSAAVSKLSVGDGTHPESRIGPLINKTAVEKVHNLVQSAKTAGAKAVIGGSIPSTDPYTRGSFYPTTVLSHCTPDMACVRNEIFGPVAAVLKFGSEDEAIRLANDTVYGLAAYFYTEDIRQAWHVSSQLNFGMIGINSPRVSSAEMPFGGIKDSGMGREGGPHALTEFMDVKTLNWDII